jgi:hypothetical protein
VGPLEGVPFVGHMEGVPFRAPLERCSMRWSPGGCPPEAVPYRGPLEAVSMVGVPEIGYRGGGPWKSGLYCG